MKFSVVHSIMKATPLSLVSKHLTVVNMYEFLGLIFLLLQHKADCKGFSLFGSLVNSV